MNALSLITLSKQRVLVFAVVSPAPGVGGSDPYDVTAFHLDRKIIPISASVLKAAYSPLNL